MYTGSDNGPTETYLMLGTSPNHQMTLLPPPQGVNYVSNEVAPELIYDQGLYYPAANYYGYFCAGLEPHGEWDDHHRIFGVDGQEIHYSALETETSPYAYYSHSYGYAQSSYNPYNPYIPGAVAGYDGPIVGLEQYLPNPYNSYIPAIAQTNLDTAPSISVSPLAFDTVSSNSSRQATAGSKFSQSRAYSRIPKSESLQTVSSETSTSVLSNPQMTQGRTFASVQNPSKVPSSSFVPNFGSSVHGWIQNPSKPDKFKSRFQFNGGVKNGNRNVDILGEQNKGPRTNKAKGNSTPAISDTGNAQGSIVISTDQYNQDDFMVDYPSAKFFVIKSYSEDDVHKSIKYNVWSSTPNGNKRLNSAYEDAKMISDVKLGNCPIFLFFSVNASGLFCGVAEMVGPVDFHKDMDFWQQDKWTGSFPVKWHVIKDVPNTSFRHIILENNENKPVTNSRDTQEVTYIPGFKMLKIFKSSPQTTSILDDFMFYEERQKILLEEKSRFTGKIYNTYIPAIVSSNKVSGSLEEKSSAHNTEKDNESGNEKENGLIDTVEVPDDKKATNPNQNGDAGVTNSVIKMNALSIDSNEGSIESDVVSIGSTNNNVKGSGEPESEIATIGSISTESKNNET